VSQVFAGQTVGVKQVDEHIWLITFMYYDLGYFDDETCRLEPIDNPFGPKLLPMSPGPRRNRYARSAFTCRLRDVFIPKNTETGLAAGFAPSSRRNEGGLMTMSLRGRDRVVKPKRTGGLG
jgi:hypothetical protein